MPASTIIQLYNRYLIIVNLDVKSLFPLMNDDDGEHDVCDKKIFSNFFISGKIILVILACWIWNLVATCLICELA